MVSSGHTTLSEWIFVQTIIFRHPTRYGQVEMKTKKKAANIT